MKKDTRSTVRARRPALSLVVAAALASSALTLGGCGPQAAAPAAAPVAVAQPQPAPVAAAQPPTQSAPVAVAQPPIQPSPTAAVPVPAPPVAQAPAVPAGRPVPTAPYDGPQPPVAYAPVPVQAAPPVARAPTRTAANESRPAVPSSRLGRVASIEPIREKPAGTGAGGVLGGVLGAVVGNQFGHGNGRAAMTVLGAAGGAVAGNTVERNVRERIVGYRVSVDLDNGDVRSYQETHPGDLQVGDRVRVDGQRLRRL